MNDVLREEKKFLLYEIEKHNLKHYLSNFLHPDKHNGLEGYRIRSLYFDTAGDDDYFDKVDGLEVRRKIRLRNYPPDMSFAVLEMKQKQGKKQRKRSLRLPREEAERLIVGDYTPLLNYKEPFALECYTLMQSRFYRPKTVVEYNRYAFIAKENNTRITFDSNIISTESNFNIFDEHLNMDPVMDKSLCVLEVKFNGFLLSYIKNGLAEVQHSETSVSKYCLARQNGYETKL